MGKGEKQIQIRGFRQGDNSVLDVEDNGFGIDRHDRQNSKFEFQENLVGSGAICSMDPHLLWVGCCLGDRVKKANIRVTIKIPVVEEQELA
jgi:hypothetical protein